MVFKMDVYNRIRVAFAAPLILVVMSAGCQTASSLKPASLFSRKASPEDQQQADLQIAFARMQEKNDESRAAELYLEALQLDPKRHDAYWRLGILMDKRGEPQKSEEYFRKAIALNDQSADLYADFGYSLFLQERFAESEEMLRKSLEISPKSMRSHNNLGMTLAALGRDQEALAHFKSGGCSTAEAQSNLAFAMACTDRLEESKSLYQSALASSPNSTKAQQGLDAIQTTMHKLGGARTPVESPTPKPLNSKSDIQLASANAHTTHARKVVSAENLASSQNPDKTQDATSSELNDQSVLGDDLSLTTWTKTRALAAAPTPSRPLKRPKNNRKPQTQFEGALGPVEGFSVDRCFPVQVPDWVPSSGI